MDLFTPVVSENLMHDNFRFMANVQLCGPERDVLQHWAKGFIDRDGKFVKEFQTTFNSSFWELYIAACFKELGCSIDFSYPTPDFLVNSPYGEFVAEATTTNSPDGYRPEWASDFSKFKDQNMDELVRLSTIRLSNAFDKKYKKYISKYSRLEHVKNKPFVMCIAPFDQPFFWLQDSFAIVRLLYAYEATLTVPGIEPGEEVIVGESRCFRIQKKPGVYLDLGLFTKPDMAEVSAVIFNNRATFCKVRALAKQGNYPVMFFGSRVAQSVDLRGAQSFADSMPDYQESILDGLHILLNPFAKNPLNLDIFDGHEVAIHSYDPESDQYLLDLPENFLLQRMCQSLPPQKVAKEFDKSKQPLREKEYKELPSEEWSEDELIHVGGQNGPFIDNHMAHYQGWTVMVSFCSNDKEWGAQAVNSLCYNIPQYIKTNRKSDVPLIVLPEWFSTLDGAYFAIKDKIDDALQDS